MKKLGEIEIGDYSCNGVCIDPSGEIGFVGSDDGGIYVVDFLEMKNSMRLKGH